MTKLTILAAAAAAAAAAFAGQAMAQESWTMTTTWPSSLELIETDKHFVDLANKLTKGELTIEFFEGGSLVPSGEVFGAVESGTIQAGADWPGYWAGRDAAFSALAPMKKAKSQNIRSVPRATLSAKAGESVVVGLVFGISKTAVTPPATAARDPVNRSSLCSGPGSRK